MSNSTIFSITAPVHTIGPVAPAGKFEKRDLVLEVGDGKFLQTVAFEAFGDKVSLLDGLSPGDEVTLRFGLRGREYNGKFYTNLSVISVDGGKGGKDAKPAKGEAPSDDDMPF